MSRQVNAALEGGPIATVPGMMNDTHIGQLLHETVADLARAILTTVVHHDDLKN
jgi:hypothetical protein